MRDRLVKISNWLNEKEVDFAFFNSVTNIYYLTNFSCKPYERLLGLVVCRTKEPILICPQMEVEHVKLTGWKYNIIGYSDNDNPWEILKKKMNSIGLNQINSFAIEMDFLTYGRTKQLEKLFPMASVLSIDKKINNLRLIKSVDEIRSIKKATQIAEESIEIGLAAIREGCTEKELISYIEHEQKKKGIADVSLSQYVLFGSNTANPHGKPGIIKLKKGDLVMFDLGVKVNGYCSDITRTFAFKEINNQIKDIYHTVLLANEKAIEGCKIGVRIGDIDKIAREIIRDAGYGEYFTHRIGHGFGLDAHEFPSMDGGNDATLESGMTFTIEPGIYIPEIGGVRIEDEVYITDKGAVTLTNYSKRMRVIN